MLLFSQKLLKGKIFKTLFPVKKIIHFRRQTPPSLQKRFGPPNGFLFFFLENTAFFEKTVE